ncbi:MAG: DUF3301 domain-containing protein [Methylococcales bacterium]
MLESSDLLLLGLIALVYMYWSNSQLAKEWAMRAVRAYCQEMEVQMLDDYIVLHRLWFKRDASGAIRFWRSYLFEFTSTGERRYKGSIVTLGRRVLNIELDPYRM